MTSHKHGGKPAMARPAYYSDKNSNSAQTGIRLLDYFAAHEEISDEDVPACQEKLAGYRMPDPLDVIAYYEFNAAWRANIRFLRAEAMVRESAQRAKGWAR